MGSAESRFYKTVLSPHDEFWTQNWFFPILVTKPSEWAPAERRGDVFMPSQVICTTVNATASSGFRTRYSEPTFSADNRYAYPSRQRHGLFWYVSSSSARPGLPLAVRRSSTCGSASISRISHNYLRTCNGDGHLSKIFVLEVKPVSPTRGEISRWEDCVVPLSKRNESAWFKKKNSMYIYLSDYFPFSFVLHRKIVTPTLFNFHNG